MSRIIETDVLSVDQFGEEYLFAWAQRGISLRVSGLRENREGDSVALLEPGELFSGQVKRLTAPTKVNLSSSVGKGQAAKAFDARLHLNAEEGLNWADAIEKVSATIYDEQRKGEPIVDLSTIAVSSSVEYLIYPYLPKGQPTVFYGDGASAKSMFMMLLAISVRHGTEVPNARGASEQGNVLYLDFETDGESQARRLGRVARGLGYDMPPEGVLYRRCSRAIVEDAPRLAVEVSRMNVKLVVVDSLAWACGDDPSDSGVAIRAMAAIRSLGCTAAVVAHYSKAEREVKGKRSIFGSAFFELAARSAWEIRADTGNQLVPNLLHQAIYHRKSNEDKLRSEPLGQVVRFMEGEGSPVQFYAEDIDAQDELAAGMPLGARIRSALKQSARPLSTVELAEQCETDTGKIRATLARMTTEVIKVGEVRIDGRGQPQATWGLKAKDDYGSTPSPQRAQVVTPTELEECAVCKRPMPIYRYNDAGQNVCLSCSS